MRVWSRLVATFGLGALALGLGVVATAEPAAADENERVVLILDASDSMNEEAPDGATRIAGAKRAVETSLDALSEDAELGMLVFGSESGTGAAEESCQDVKTLAELGAPDRQDLRDSVQAIEASGYTPIGLALREASDMLGSGPGKIVLVSDGLDTCAPPPACDVAVDLRQNNPELVMDVVGFAVEEDDEALQQLECIAGAGGGVYVAAEDEVGLTARLSSTTNLAQNSKALSERGARNIQLGMSKDEVLTVVGQDAPVTEREVDGVKVVYIDCGWATVELRDGEVTSIVPTEDISTAEGLTTGDEQSRAEGIYGEAVSSGEDDEGDYQVYRANQGTSGYRVYLDGGIIRQIIVCRCVVPAYDRDDVSTWNVTFDGIGPFLLGRSLDDIAADVEKLDGLTYEAEDIGEFELEVDDDDRLVRIRFASTYLDSMGMSDRLIASGVLSPAANGIRVGFPIATVRTAFPSGVDWQVVEGSSSQSSYRVADRTGRYIAFALSWQGQCAGDCDALIREESQLGGFEVGGPRPGGSIQEEEAGARPSGAETEVDPNSMLNSTIEGAVCGPDAGFTTQVVQLEEGSGEGIGSDGTYAGPSIMDLELLGGGDIDRDGKDEIVASYSCAGTPIADCCAGRGSLWKTVGVFEPKRVADSRSSATHIGGPLRVRATSMDRPSIPSHSSSSPATFWALSSTSSTLTTTPRMKLGATQSETS